MSLRVVILCVDRERQGSNRIENGMRETLRALRSGGHSWFTARCLGCGERLSELLQARVNFFKGFRARRKQALESHSEISLEDVALPLFRFVGIEVVGRGDRISPLVF